MEKRKRILIAVFLMLAIGNYVRLQGNENIRAIQFVTIFTIGLLSGLLLHEIAVMIRSKN